MEKIVKNAIFGLLIAFGVKTLIFSVFTLLDLGFCVVLALIYYMLHKESVELAKKAVAEDRQILENRIAGLESQIREVGSSVGSIKFAQVNRKG